MFPESHRCNSNSGDQVLAALSVVSGVLYCFQNQLTSVDTDSLKSHVTQGICPDGRQGFSLHFDNEIVQ